MMQRGACGSGSTHARCRVAQPEARLGYTATLAKAGRAQLAVGEFRLSEPGDRGGTLPAGEAILDTPLGHSANDRPQLSALLRETVLSAWGMITVEVALDDPLPLEEFQALGKKIRRDALERFH